MNVLKIIFYGLLAFIERHPFFCTILVLLAIFAPFVFEIVGWIILGIITLLLIVFGILAWKVHKMKREMKKRFEQGGANFSGGSFGGQNFGGHFYAGGMTLEELVRQMQAQAEAEQMAQMATPAKDMAQAAKVMAETPTQGGNVLDDLLGGGIV